MLGSIITEGQTMLLVAGLALVYFVALTFVLAFCRMAKLSGEAVLKRDPRDPSRGDGLPVVPLKVRVLPLRFDDDDDEPEAMDHPRIASGQ